MAFLIQTDTENLNKSMREKRIRTPRGLRDKTDLRRIRRGDSIFLYNYETERIHGPVISRSVRVIEEENPVDGPFNGPVGNARFSMYDSIEVDISPLHAKGCSAMSTGVNRQNCAFCITGEQEERLLVTLRHSNTGAGPLVINMVPVYDTLQVTIVEIERGTLVSNRIIDGRHRLLHQIDEIKRMGEDALCRKELRKFGTVVTELGTALYERIIAPLELDRLHQRGGYRIYISGPGKTFDIPVELSFNSNFLFERNIVSYITGRPASTKQVSVEKILIVADPAHNCTGADREGERLYEFFLHAGFHVDLISRPLRAMPFAVLLSEYDIIHYCGHYDSVDTDPGWDIGYCRFSATDFHMVRKPPFLVVSSACGNSTEMGWGMIEHGVVNTISARWTIPDSDMGDFCIAFYTALFNSMDIGYSFNSAVCHAYTHGSFTPLAFTLQGESRIIYEKKNN